jgi:hypothetical protein
MKNIRLCRRLQFTEHELSDIFKRNQVVSLICCFILFDQRTSSIPLSSTHFLNSSHNFAAPHSLSLQRIFKTPHTFLPHRLNTKQRKLVSSGVAVVRQRGEKVIHVAGRMLETSQSGGNRSLTRLAAWQDRAWFDFTEPTAARPRAT